MSVSTGSLTGKDHTTLSWIFLMWDCTSDKGSKWASVRQAETEFPATPSQRNIVLRLSRLGLGLVMQLFPARAESLRSFYGDCVGLLHGDFWSSLSWGITHPLAHWHGTHNRDVPAAVPLLQRFKMQYWVLCGVWCCQSSAWGFSLEISAPHALMHSTSLDKTESLVLPVICL